MTEQEIRDAINASPELTALVPDTAALAAALSLGRTRIDPRHGGIGLILETLGPDTGAAVLDNMDALRATSAAVKWAWHLLERGDLNFGSPTTRGMINALFADNVPVRDALLATAEVLDPISEFEVRKAIYAADGTLLVGGE